MTIAQITDLHLDDFMAGRAGIDGRRNVLKILEAVEKQGIHDLVLTGDIGIPGSHQWLLDAIAARNQNALFTLGNHDEATDFRNLAAVSDFIKPDGLYYYLVREGVSCIFLDSSRGLIEDGQLIWLESELKEAGQDAGQHIAVFVHHPILDCGGTTMDRRYPLRNRDQVLQILTSSGRRTSIFCGHYHTFHEQSAGEISQYVTPSALLQLKQHSDELDIESKSYGYRLVRLSSDAIETEVVLLND